MNELTELKLTFLKLMYKTELLFSHIMDYLPEFTGPVTTDTCVSDLSILFKASISSFLLK